MELADLGKLLDHLNRDAKAPMWHRSYVGKIRALWWTLYWLGEIADPKDAPLDAFVKRQTGAGSLRFLDHRKAHSVIEALKSWAARCGVVWPKDAGTDGGLAERRAVLTAIWLKLADAHLVRPGGMEAYLASALNVQPAVELLDRHELDAAIRLLGKQLRRGLAKREGSGA